MDANISNAVWSKFKVHKELKGTRSNVTVSIAQDIIRQENKTLKRMERAVNKFGNKITPYLDLEKLEEELNIEQKDMIPLESIVEHDPKHESRMLECIVNYLQRTNRIEKITVGTTGSEHIICHAPHTDVYIKPYTRDGKDNIYVKEVLAVSEKIADEIIDNYNYIWQ